MMRRSTCGTEGQEGTSNEDELADEFHGDNILIDIGEEEEERAEDNSTTNWNESPYFSGGFFSKLPNEFAQCNHCPKANPMPKGQKQPKGIVRRTDSNSSGMKSHLESKHRDLVAEFQKKKDEVELMRDKFRSEKASRKRRVSGKQEEAKQSKLTTEGGNLIMRGRPVDPNLQKEWDDAMSDFIADTHVSFSQMSGEPFAKLINVINRRSMKVQVKSRKVLSKHIGVRADEVLEDVSKIIKATRQDMVSCSFTTDLWTSRAQDAFLCLTVHFIDR